MERASDFNWEELPYLIPAFSQAISFLFSLITSVTKSSSWYSATRDCTESAILFILFSIRSPRLVESSSELLPEPLLQAAVKKRASIIKRGSIPFDFSIATFIPVDLVKIWNNIIMQQILNQGYIGVLLQHYE